MKTYIKLISEDKAAAAAIKKAAEDYNFTLSGDNSFNPADLNHQSCIIIADRRSTHYNSFVDEVKLRGHHYLILLAERDDHEIFTDIKLLKPSGIIYKPVDPLYLYAAIETAASGLSGKGETFLWDSIVQAVDESPVLILMIETNGKVKYANRTFRNVTGYDSSELEFLHLNNSNVLPNIINTLTMAIRSSDKWIGEITDLNKKGEEFTIRSTILPVKNPHGTIIGYVAIADDFSGRKEMEVNIEKARIISEEASEAKSRFIATISHEIRTPMNAIIGMTDLALLTNDSEEILDYLIDLKTAAGRLLNLTDNILDFSRMETGELKLDPGVFNISRLVEGAVNRFKQSAKEKGLGISYSVLNGDDNSYYGDSARIGQILDHFISNSIKFSESGYILVEVSTSGETYIHREMKYLIQFSVSDNGIGIPLEKQSIIFEKFRQVEDSTTRRWGGTGLGLSISKSLVELMNGTIGVESTPGSGSRFFFRLPLLKVEADVQKIFLRSDSLNRPPDIVLRVLIVEDNPVNSRLAEIVLKKLGHIAETARNGLIALEMLRESCFDIIFMDVEMPVMDGIETTRHIRSGAAGRNNENIPVVAITAHAVAEYEHECLKAGMNYFLTKPINITLIPELLSRINSGCS